MIAYGILICVAAALFFRSSASISRQAEREQDVDIRASLLKAAKRRQLSFYAALIVGLAVIIGTFVLLAEIQ